MTSYNSKTQEVLYRNYTRREALSLAPLKGLLKAIIYDIKETSKIVKDNNA